MLKRWFPELMGELAARKIRLCARRADEHDLCASLPATMLMDGDKFLTSVNWLVWQAIADLLWATMQAQPYVVRCKYKRCGAVRF